MMSVENVHFVSRASDARSVGELLSLYEVSASDLARVRDFGTRIEAQAEGFVEAFYEWLGAQPEFAEFFSDAETLSRVKVVQGQSWRDLFSGTFDDELLERRRQIGLTHARIGLPPNIYLAAMNKSMLLWVERFHDGTVTPETLTSVAKLMHMDSAVVIDTFIARTNEIIAGQRQLLEMSTPVAALWDDVLMLPVVGIIDSRRAQTMMNDVLSKIADSQAKVFVLDISGVAVVDTAVANHLIKITKATRLMGCDCIISGLSSAIAQTIVELGIDVGSVRTTATLRDAVRMAFSLVDTEIRRAS